MNPPSMRLLAAPIPGFNIRTQPIGLSVDVLGFPVVIQRDSTSEALSRPEMETSSPGRAIGDPGAGHQPASHITRFPEEPPREARGVDQR